MANEDQTDQAKVEPTASAEAPEVAAIGGPEGVPMRAPKGASEFSWHGIIHKVEKGLVMVPHAAIEDLKSHGFKLEL